MLLLTELYDGFQVMTTLTVRTSSGEKQGKQLIDFFSFLLRSHARHKLHLENVHALLVALGLLPRLVVDPADAGVASHAEHIPHNVLARRHVARLRLGRPDVDERPEEVASAVGAAEILENPEVVESPALSVFLMIQNCLFFFASGLKEKKKKNKCKRFVSFFIPC